MNVITAANSATRPSTTMVRTIPGIPTHFTMTAVATLRLMLMTSRPSRSSPAHPRTPRASPPSS